MKEILKGVPFWSYKYYLNLYKIIENKLYINSSPNSISNNTCNNIPEKWTCIADIENVTDDYFEISMYLIDKKIKKRFFFKNIKYEKITN